MYTLRWYDQAMSEYANSIGRGDVAGVQKEQTPPRYKERPGVAKVRKQVERHNAKPPAKRRP